MDKFKSLEKIFYHHEINCDPDSVSMLNFILEVEEKLEVNLLDYEVSRLRELKYIREIIDGKKRRVKVS